MIVDVYKIFTENSFGKTQTYNMCVENNVCQTRVTSMALSWLASTGQMACIDKPNFRYQYSELASDDIRTLVMDLGFAIFNCTASVARPAIETLQMDGLCSLGEPQ